MTWKDVSAIIGALGFTLTLALIVWRGSAAIEGMRKDIESLSREVETVDDSHPAIWDAVRANRDKDPEILERLTRVETKLDMLLTRRQGGS